MLRLIIKFLLVFFIIFYIYTHPIPVACFCGNNSWWNRCIQGTDESSKMCQEIDYIINIINDDLLYISNGLTRVFDVLSQDIPTIPTDIPKIADLVSSTYTNYTIDSVPQIPYISNFSCRVYIPLSVITNATNTATTQITNQLKNITDKINSLPFFIAINRIIDKLNYIKSKIESLDLSRINNIDVGDIIKQKLNQAIRLAEEKLKEFTRLAEEEAIRVANEARRLADIAERETKRLADIAEREAIRVANELRNVGDKLNPRNWGF